MNAKYRYLVRFVLAMALMAIPYALVVPWLREQSLLVIVVAFLVFAASYFVLDRLFAVIPWLRN